MAGKESTPKRFSAPAYYLHAVVCLLIMFGFGQLPPVEPLTPLGMNLIGIFLGVLYGWVCIEIVWPSLAGLLALMLIGGMKPMMLLNKSFGDPVVQMMFFIFVFCATI
ncbi:MAG: SLC13 family permease, partial [Desulfovibrio piger]|nr:SLC13 family permease [Desulfovibrio piger]